MKLRRKMDPMRRIAIPAEVCRELNIHPGDLVEFDVDADGRMVIERCQLSGIRCSRCGTADGHFVPVDESERRHVCFSCADVIATEAEARAKELARLDESRAGRKAGAAR